MQSHLADLLQQSLVALRADASIPHDVTPPVQISIPRHKTHGDYATNLALVMAGMLRQDATELAAEIVRNLPADPAIKRVAIAGAGFINFFVHHDYLLKNLAKILQQAENYGRGAVSGERVLVEFVSSNPTGPLHIGHGRCAVYGDALVRLLGFAGYSVASEYYINDAGRQIDILALSFWLRGLQYRGIPLSFPENGYQGAYLTALAEEYAQDLRWFAANDEELDKVSERVLAKPSDNDDAEGYLDVLISRMQEQLGAEYQSCCATVVARMTDDIRTELRTIGIEFDRWYSEKAMLSQGKLAQVETKLQQQELLYQQDHAWWFAARRFGDDKDRVVRRSNGQGTYFASDIAYHEDKFARGFDRLINVLGADHHGYVKRLKAIIAAFGRDPESLEAPLVQMVSLIQQGRQVAMSTRSGNFYPLGELSRQIGIDALRFFYLLQNINQHLEIDIDLAKMQHQCNPVYYVQYAHARIVKLLLGADQEDAHDTKLSILQNLTDPLEHSLMERLYQFPERIQQAAEQRAPHMLTQYARELATAFHSFYNALPVLHAENQSQRCARLTLCHATRITLCNLLRILGISAPQHM